ncbi:MAG TPA: response regulator [Thermoanaerobaculia bacterium]
MSASPGPVIRVVDDDDGFRTAVTRLLHAAGFEVRAYASAGDFLLAEEDPVPGCVLLDLRMPGPNGLDLQASLARRGAPLPIIFLTAHGDVAASVRAMKGGAEDFLTKPVKREVLLSAIRDAIRGDEARRGSREEIQIIRKRYEALSPRERSVLDHVVAGRLNKQIASAIGASERTVKAHRARVMSKMGASSVAELVRAIDRLGLAFPLAQTGIAAS